MLWRIFNIKNILESLGCDVDLICYTFPSIHNNMDDKDLPSEIIFKKSIIPHMSYIKDFNKYDLIYANTNWSAINAMIGKCKKKTTIISDVHGLISEEYLMKLNNNRLSYILRFMVDTISISHSDKLVCVSKTMINYLHKYKNVPLTKMFYVTNGVDLNFFSPIEKSEVSNAKQKLGLNDKLVFGYVGGFQQWQGAGNLIKAASCMDDRDVKFIVVGGNNDKPITKKNILYLPRMSRSSLLKYYSLCDILVLPRPSHVATEVAAPTKFAEYAAMSRPILTTRVGDAAMLVKEYKCGIVISDNKPHTLINGFRAFKTFSKKELFTMGTNSRKMAEEEFNWSRQKLALKHCLEI